MTPRAVRRAAERRAQKDAHRSVAAAERTTTELLTRPEPPGPASRPVSESRLAANRANAQLSTGPTSEAGKRVASLNAVKSALTGQTVLLPTDDVARYQALVASLVEQHQPATDAQRRLVQSVADAEWRLARIPVLENAIFVRARVEFADKFSASDPTLAVQMIESETLVAYEKQLRNLQTQEGRLHRHRDKDLAELKALQTGDETRPAATAPQRPAVKAVDASVVPALPASGARVVPLTHHAHGVSGFEFSTAIGPSPNTAGTDVSVVRSAA